LQKEREVKNALPAYINHDLRDKLSKATAGEGVKKEKKPKTMLVIQKAA